MIWGDFVDLLIQLNADEQIPLTNLDDLISFMPNGNVRIGRDKKRHPYLCASFRHGAHDWVRKQEKTHG